MKDAGFIGLILAGGIAVVAALLQAWEARRSEWIPRSRPERLSFRLRRAGMVLLWLEAFLIAIGSLLPVESKNDRILFVSVWGLVGLVSVVLVVIAFADSLVRLLVGRALIEELSKSRNRTPEAGPLPEADPRNPSADPFDDFHR